jgi:hypothetical protein
MTFTWVYMALSTGLVDFTASVSGSDVYFGSGLSDSSTAGPVVVTGAALLTSTFVGLASNVKAGDTYDVQLRVSNIGSVDAKAVVPTLTFDDPAKVGTVTGPLPAGGLKILAGSSTIFTWRVQPIVAGTLVLSGDTSGVDDGDGLPVQSSATGNQTVMPTFDEPLVAYPNPVAGDALRVALKLEADTLSVQVEVFNIAMEKTYSGEWRDVRRGEELVISGMMRWAPGVYLMRAKAKYRDGSEQRFKVMKLKVQR